MYNLLFLEGQRIAGRAQTQNMGFILFLACFFILIYQVSNNSKLLLAMVGKLFGNKERTASGEPFTGEKLNILFFCIQTVLLASIIIYCHIVNRGFFKIESPSGMYVFSGFTALYLSLFIGYKYLAYSFIGYVFFDKAPEEQWKDTFSSAICLSGVVLFFPTLVLFYMEKMYTYGIYILLIYFIFIQIILFYRQFVLFFNKKSSLLYFILYLCTQEIVPLFLLYKGFVYLFLTHKESSLWTQL